MALWAGWASNPYFGYQNIPKCGYRKIRIRIELVLHFLKLFYETTKIMTKNY